MSWKETLLAQYPDALSRAEVTDKYVDWIEKDYGADRESTLLTTSVCSDEINRESSNFPKEFVGEGPFFLGGLAGFPYTGKTGLTAFAHHIPDDGTAFIFYGAHIGVDDEGNLGKVARKGQANIGSSCGALMLTLGRMKDDSYAPGDDESDYQQMTLEKTLWPYKTQILNAENPVVEITEIAYRLINEQVRALVEAVKGEFHCARIALLGGILINTSPDKDDFVDVRDFEVIELAHH